jgi:hypothetical protein
MEPAIAPEMIAATPRPAHVVRVMFADSVLDLGPNKAQIKVLAPSVAA